MRNISILLSYLHPLLVGCSVVGRVPEYGFATSSSEPRGLDLGRPPSALELDYRSLVVKNVTALLAQDLTIRYSNCTDHPVIARRPLLVPLATSLRWAHSELEVSMDSSVGKPTNLPTDLPANTSVGDPLLYRAGDALSFHVLPETYTPNEVLPPIPDMHPNLAKAPATWVFTSPNVIGDMPKPPICKRIVQGRSDARYALDDRTLHPQLIVPEFEWMACIPRRSSAPPDLLVLWWTPSKADAPAVQGNTLVHQVRVFKSAKIADLKAVLAKCEACASTTLQAHPSASLLSVKAVHAADCLEQVSVFGMEFRDLLQTLTDFQKACLDILALCHYLDVRFPLLAPRTIGDTKPHPVNMALMGGWTRSLSFAQKFHRMGIPVWLIRPHWALNPSDMKIYDKGKKNYLVHDDRIVLEPYKESDSEIRPYPVLWSGLPCTDMHRSMHNLGYNIIDASLSSRRGWDRLTGTSNPPATTPVHVFALPPGTTVPSSTDRTSTTTQAATSPSFPVGDFMKYIDYITSDSRPALDPDAEEPPQVPIWQAAIQNIDVSKRPVIKKGTIFSGYRLPPPDIFSRPRTRRGRVLYLATWLASRSVHLSNILKGTVAFDISFQNWRHHLHSIAEHLQPANAEPFDSLNIDETEMPSSLRGGPSRSVSVPAPSASSPVSRPPTPSASRPAVQPVQVGKKRAHSSLGGTHLPERPQKKAKPRTKPNQYLEEELSVKDQPIAAVHWIEKTALLGTPEQLEAALTPQVTAEVLWEVQEDCFRLDLLALDQALASHKWPSSDTDKSRAIRTERTRNVRNVFPSKPGPGLVLDGFIVSQIPNVDRGLAAYDYYGRHMAVRALRDLMVDWEGCPQELRSATLGLHRRHADELEALVVPFYCQSFFNTFGRIPVPPPRLPYISTTREAPRSVSAEAMNQL